MQAADRLQKIPPYLFVTLRNKINKARAEGVDVINLGVGDPVDPTPQSMIDELCRQAKIPINHQYPIDEEKGMLPFRQEVARWYSKRYDVELNPEGEVLGLIGSKEGCHHFILGIVNPGDVVLMTDPGIPGLPGSPSTWPVPNLIPCPCWRRITISRISTGFRRKSSGGPRPCS